MRLHEFILTHIEQILSAWERFARSVETALPPMDSKGLRDHSEHILKPSPRICKDPRASGSRSPNHWAMVPIRKAIHRPSPMQ